MQYNLNNCTHITRPWQCITTNIELFIFTIVYVAYIRVIDFALRCNLCAECYFRNFAPWWIYSELICCTVATPPRPCNKTQSLPLTSSEGWISSLVTAETKCGTKDSPWAIEALPGQRIKLTLNDLSGVCSGNRYVRHILINCLRLPPISLCLFPLIRPYQVIWSCCLHVWCSAFWRAIEMDYAAQWI